MRLMLGDCSWLLRQVRASRRDLAKFGVEQLLGGMRDIAN